MNDNSGMDESTPQPQPQQPQQPQTISPQHRLQQLRAIPDKDKKDAEWDELNELEITLASSNRLGNPDPNIRREGGGQRGGQPQRGGGQPGQPGNNQNRNRQNRGRHRQR
jgi:hypothetical protein